MLKKIMQGLRDWQTFIVSTCITNSRDGQVVRASAFRAVDSGLIPSLVKPMAFKLVFTVSPLDAQHEKGQCEEQADKIFMKHCQQC